MLLLTALLLPALLASAAPVERSEADAGTGNGTGTGGDSTSPATGPLLSAEMRAYFDTAFKRWDIPGAALVVVASPLFTRTAGEEGWVTEFYSHGVANAAGDMVTEDTLFPLASNTKLFTALSAAAVLAGHNHTWATKVKDVLPEWQLMDPYASDHVDMIDLAAMRSGLPGHPLADFNGKTDSEVVSNLRNLPLSAEIRQQYQYNNHHYATLAHVITTLTGTPYVDWMAANVLGPLNMTATTFDHTGVKTESFSRSGVSLQKCGSSPDIDHLDPACFGTIESIGWWNPKPYVKGAGAGGAGLITNTRDLARWLRELLVPGVFPSELHEAVNTPVIVTGAADMGLGMSAYGAGQVITSIAGQSLYMHTGNLPGASTLVVRLPESGLALAILANEDHYSPMFLQQAIAVQIAGELLGLPVPDMQKEVADQLKLAIFLTTPVPPENPAPLPDGTSAEGTYSHPGYSSFTLRKMADSPADKAIAAGLGHIGLRNSTDGVYIAELAGTDGWPVMQSHLALSHWDGAGFNLTSWNVVERNGKLVVPDVGSWFPAIVTPEGIGMFGGFWGAGNGVAPREPTTENTREAAEVFFSRG